MPKSIPNPHLTRRQIISQKFPKYFRPQAYSSAEDFQQMSKQEDATLILKLYELRREEVMRAARAWYVRDFNPVTMEDFVQAITGDHSGDLRMVISYWDMAAALVNEGAINLQMFDKTNAEHIVVFCKIEKLLPEIRTAMSPHFARNLETLIDAIPEGRQRVTGTRERLALMRARMAKK
jgi:hypothetical protein